MRNTNIINKGQLAAELGLEKVAKKALLSTPNAGGQFLDDIYGYKNASGAYIPFSDIYGAAYAQLRANQQHANIKRKYATAALVKLGVLTRGSKLGGRVITSTKLDEDKCIVGKLMIPDKAMSREMYSEVNAINGIYRRFKNNYGFNGLEHDKLATITAKVVKILTALNKELESAYVSEQSDKRAAKERGDDPRMIDYTNIIKDIISTHLCA